MYDRIRCYLQFRKLKPIYTQAKYVKDAVYPGLVGTVPILPYHPPGPSVWRRPIVPESNLHGWY